MNAMKKEYNLLAQEYLSSIKNKNNKYNIQTLSNSLNNAFFTRLYAPLILEELKADSMKDSAIFYQKQLPEMLKCICGDVPLKASADTKINDRVPLNHNKDVQKLLLDFFKSHLQKSEFSQQCWMWDAFEALTAYYGKSARLAYNIREIVLNQDEKIHIRVLACLCDARLSQTDGSLRNKNIKQVWRIAFEEIVYPSKHAQREKIAEKKKAVEAKRDQQILKQKDTHDTVTFCNSNSSIIEYNEISEQLKSQGSDKQLISYCSSIEDDSIVPQISMQSIYETSASSQDNFFQFYEADLSEKQTPDQYYADSQTSVKIEEDIDYQQLCADKFIRDQQVQEQLAELFIDCSAIKMGNPANHTCQTPSIFLNKGTSNNQGQVQNQSQSPAHRQQQQQSMVK